MLLVCVGCLARSRIVLKSSVIRFDQLLSKRLFTALVMGGLLNWQSDRCFLLRSQRSLGLGVGVGGINTLLGIVSRRYSALEPMTRSNGKDDIADFYTINLLCPLFDPCPPRRPARPALHDRVRPGRPNRRRGRSAQRTHDDGLRRRRRGRRSTTAYDLAGRTLAAVDPLNERTTTVYDAAGEAVGKIDPLGLHTTTAYDPAGRASPSSIRSANGPPVPTENAILAAEGLDSRYKHATTQCHI